MNNNTENPYRSKNWLKAIRDIYKLRIIQVLQVLIILSVVFYVLDYFAYNQVSDFWIYLRKFPLRALADACLTAFLVGFTYEWIVRRESEATLLELLSEKMSEQKAEIIEEIPRALILNPETMEKVLKNEKVDEVIRKSLQVKLGDHQMGNDLYEGLLRKTLSYSQRWTNYRYKATLSFIRDTTFPEIVRDKFYELTIDLRYETKLNKRKFIFRCVNNVHDYDKSIRDSDNEFTWHFPPAPEFQVLDSTLFMVDKIMINDLELEITSTTEPNGNILVVCTHPEIDKYVGQIVTIYYRYITKINKRGHLFSATVIVPTKYVVIELDYADTDIHYVNVLDFFVSTDIPKITYLPSSKRAHKIEVELNEWAFPKGGVVFVWVLKNEMSNSFLKYIAESNNNE